MNELGHGKRPGEGCREVTGNMMCAVGSPHIP